VGLISKVGFFFFFFPENGPLHPLIPTRPHSHFLTSSPSFSLSTHGPSPNLVDKFGWCTWDAFYLAVEPVGIWHGVNEFAKGGVSPRFLIIDDGWQSINLYGENPNRRIEKEEDSGEGTNTDSSSPPAQSSPGFLFVISKK
jgi:hypothetical protein